MSILKVFGVLLGLFFLWKILNILALLFVVLILVAALGPWVEWLVENGLPRAISVSIIYIFLFLILGFLVSLLLPPLVIQLHAFTAAFPASPGKQPPPQLEFRPGSGLSRVIEFFGPLCPLPGYKNLDAGAVTIQGPGFGPVEAAPAVVDGQRIYRGVLPNGTIRPGSFTVTAGGSSELGPFQSTLRIGSGINIASSFPPGAVVRSQTTGGPPLTVNWTGGDPDTWVTLALVSHQGVADVYNLIYARASTGTATIGTGGLPTGSAEIILEVIPDPAQVPALSVPGLSLGGQHSWRYTYRFGGLTLQ
jgi:hypothetical protein